MNTRLQKLHEAKDVRVMLQLNKTLRHNIDTHKWFDKHSESSNVMFAACVARNQRSPHKEQPSWQRVSTLIIKIHET